MAARPVATLDEAPDVLEVLPLDFGGKPSSRASDPAFYTEPPPPDHDELPGPGPAESIRDQLLRQNRPIKVFLSGHVGSGKSTQINRLAADAEIQGAFSVILLRIEALLSPFLDAAQLLFLMAGEVFAFASKEQLLTQGGKWQGLLRDLDRRLFGEAGITATEGSISAEFNLMFIKIREELKLSEHRRRQFRDLGETQQTLLLDLLKALTLDIETELVKRGKHRSLLVMIDDLDKVRGVEQQKDIFDTNLSALFEPPFRVLYTVPTGVVFGPNRHEVRRALEHIYPLRVLDKAPNSFDPERAFIPGGDEFFRRALDHRVEPGLIDDDAVRLAAIYSGGVLREFFRLLRSAARLARHNKLDVVEKRAVKAAIRDERVRESTGLLAPDYEALLAVHQTHAMQRDEDRRYLDESRVLECYNDRTWYEVNPLLWSLLEPRG